MKWLTLPLIKNQLRLEPDYNDENEMLELYGNSAEEVVMEYIRRDYDEIIEKYKSVPVNLVHASLMLVDISYQNRSAVSPQNMSVIPYGNIDTLVKPYCKL